MCAGLVEFVPRPKMLEQTRYFNVNFDSNGFLFLFFLIFLIFQRSTFNLEKKHLLRKVSFHLVKVAGSTYHGIIFQTMDISKIST